MKPLHWKIVAAFLLLAMLFACAAPGTAPRQAADPQQMRLELEALPGAVPFELGLGVTYPGENLFSPGAALPMPGGLDVIDPLAQWLVAHPGMFAEGVVRSAGHTEAYDLKLANKRLELLTRILVNRGVAAERLLLVAEAAEGSPLEISFQPISERTSSGEKE